MFPWEVRQNIKKINSINKTMICIEATLSVAFFVSMRVYFQEYRLFFQRYRPEV